MSTPIAPSDLTQRPPRSMRARLGGFVPLPRILDKGRATLDGILLEHWDVIQDEATKEQSKSGNPMFGDSFPDRA